MSSASGPSGDGTANTTPCSLPRSARCNMCAYLVLCIPEKRSTLPAHAPSRAAAEPTRGVSVFRKGEANTLMEIHEFQAKALLARYAVACPTGMLATSADGAERAARQIGPGPGDGEGASARRRPRGRRRYPYVARSPEFGRGRGGRAAPGRRLVTEQTGPGGEIVKRVLVEASVSSVQD